VSQCFADAALPLGNSTVDKLQISGQRMPALLRRGFPLPQHDLERLQLRRLRLDEPLKEIFNDIAADSSNPACVFSIGTSQKSAVKKEGRSLWSRREDDPLAPGLAEILSSRTVWR
jgi:hypothetical protein